MTTRWLDADQQQAWRAYLVGTTLLMERLDRDLRENHDLSLPEYEILVRLSEAPERMLRMAELADAVKNSRSRITHTIARMEREGLVERRQCAADGRGVLAILTDKGYAMLVDAAPSMSTPCARPSSTWSTPPTWKPCAARSRPSPTRSRPGSPTRSSPRAADDPAAAAKPSGQAQPAAPNPGQSRVSRR